MSILKNFQYTQVNKSKYLEALKALKDGQHLDKESFLSIAYNLNKLENRDEVVQLMLKSSVDVSVKKKFIKLLSMKEIVKILSLEKTYVKFFMYPNILPVSVILLIISVLLKPYGIMIIAGYLLSTLQLRKILNKRVVKELVVK